MTIKDCIDIVDSNKPNQYTITDKVRWLSFIDEKIINDVLKTHEGYDGRYDDFTGYSDDKLSVTLIAPSPYDRLYTQYLKMKIDEENGETARYNNSATLFNSYYLEYKKYYNKLHKPLSNSSSGCNSNIKTNCKAVTDAELESLKNELSFILKNYFADTISDDKVNDVVTKYMQNNTELFKGKDGKTPVKGFDYFTPEEVKEFQKILDDNFNDLKESELGKKEDLITSNNENIVGAINEIFSELIQFGSFVPSALDKKVDKVEGRGLSEANYTASDKTLLYRINNQIEALKQDMAYKVDAVPGKTLSSNDYTSEDKALLRETKTQMLGKVDKEFGKGLSTEDYTTNEKKSVEYLSSYFKTVPEGKTIDDLGSLEDVGCYILFNTNHLGHTGLLYVTYGIYSDNDNRADIPCAYQTRYIQDAIEGMGCIVKIERRNNAYGWSDWEDVFATKDYVDSVNIKINEIIDSAPDALNTLKELADALNNEPDFAGTVANSLENKVDKEFGKGLSTEDYTTEDKALLYETKMQMSGKVDKESGKGLSENNYSNEDKTFVSNLKNGGIATKEDVLKSTSNTLENVVKGNAIRIDDVSPNKHTIQVMARGKNLFGLIGRSEMSFGEFDCASKRTFTGKGIYYAVSGSNYYKAASAIITDNNNSIKINTTDAWYGVGIDIKVRPSTTYTLSGEIPGGSYIAISQYDSEGEHIGYSHYASTSTFVTSPQTSWILAIMVNEIANSESIFKSIQLEEGNVASYYKQYINPATITVKRLKKNLIPYPYAETAEKPTVTKEGIKFDVSVNGIIKATGKAKETISFGVSIKNNGGLYLIKGQSYFFSCVTNNSSLDSYYAFVSDANGDNYFDTGKGVVVTPQVSGYASVYIVVKKGVNLSSVVYKPMLEVGTTRSRFEKYDIENIDLNESGIENVESLSPTITFLVTNPFIDIEASYNQDINVTIKLGEQNGQLIHEIQKRQFKKVAHGKEVTLTDSCYSNLENLTLYGRTTQSGTPSYSSSVPLVSIGDKGSITVQVGNENESQTLKIPIRVPLYGLPVSSGGNFVDSDGKQWLCNVIDLAKGVYIQKVALEEVVFSSFGTHTNGIPYGVVNLPLKTKTHSLGMLCERAMYVSGQGIVADTFYENVSNCVFNGSEGEDSAAVTEKYEGCKIMYPLRNEVVLPLSSEITELFRNIHTYKPTTNIKNDALAHMDVEYYVDIPAYVGNQIAQIPTGGGGGTFFESSTPQIDITLEEAVKTLTISELNGKPLSEYNYNTMRIVLENAKLEVTGENSEIAIRLNKNTYASEIACSINIPSTFINNSNKQYWGGYISLPENLYLGGQTASSNEFWRTNIQMPVNTSTAMTYKQIERIYIQSTSSMIPVGTKIKVWFK